MRVDVGSMSRTVAVPENSDTTHFLPIEYAPTGVPHVYSNFSDKSSAVTIADVNLCDAIVAGPVRNLLPGHGALATTATAADEGDID